MGRATASRLDIADFDVDYYYWMPTDPPYRVKRDREDRIALLARDLDGRSGWVISGSLDGWGDGVIVDADIVVYLNTPTEVRLQRLRLREAARFGDKILCERSSLVAPMISGIANAPSIASKTQAALWRSVEPMQPA